MISSMVDEFLDTQFGTKVSLDSSTFLLEINSSKTSHLRANISNLLKQTALVHPLEINFSLSLI